MFGLERPTRSSSADRHPRCQRDGFRMRPVRRVRRARGKTGPDLTESGSPPHGAVPGRAHKRQNALALPGGRAKLSPESRRILHKTAEKSIYSLGSGKTPGRRFRRECRCKQEGSQRANAFHRSLDRFGPWIGVLRRVRLEGIITRTYDAIQQ